MWIIFADWSEHPNCGGNCSNLYYRKTKEQADWTIFCLVRNQALIRKVINLYGECKPEIEYESHKPLRI